MFLEMSISVKFASAVLASKWLDVQMSSLVLPSVSIRNELLATELASVGLLASVSTNVMDKTGSMLEYFFARSERTLIRPHIDCSFQIVVFFIFLL